VVVAVEVIVDVMAVAGAGVAAGFGASCFWHPITANVVTIAATAMMTDIFFTIFHLLSFREHNRNAFEE
jgi:hypothetical protein